MDRLTKRTSSGTFLNVETKTGGIVVSRLAAYEDTGLTPEEIQRVKAERDAAISCISRNCAHIEFIEGGISYCVLKGAGCDDCEDVWCKAGDSE